MSTGRVVPALHAIVVAYGSMCRRPMAASVQLVYKTLEQGKEAQDEQERNWP